MPEIEIVETTDKDLEITLEALKNHPDGEAVIEKLGAGGTLPPKKKTDG